MQVIIIIVTNIPTGIITCIINAIGWVEVEASAAARGIQTAIFTATNISTTSTVPFFEAAPLLYKTTKKGLIRVNLKLSSKSGIAPRPTHLADPTPEARE